MIKISKIAATLQYGIVFSGLLLAMLYFILCCGMALLIVPPIIAIIQKIKLTEVMIIGSMLFGAGCLLFSGYHLLKEGVIRRKIKRWLGDAVLLRAISKKLLSAGIPSSSKIQIEFVYNRKKKKQVSLPGKLLQIQTIFSRYADREIQILYSPKYDQVMILKDK